MINSRPIGFVDYIGALKSFVGRKEPTRILTVLGIQKMKVITSQS